VLIDRTFVVIRFAKYKNTSLNTREHGKSTGYDTLEALQYAQDAINEIKVRKNITAEKEKLQDYDKIIKHLEESISDMLNAVVIFQKYEKAL